MPMPGFTAHASIYETSRHYRVGRESVIRATALNSIHPARYERVGVRMNGARCHGWEAYGVRVDDGHYVCRGGRCVCCASLFGGLISSCVDCESTDALCGSGAVSIFELPPVDLLWGRPMVWGGGTVGMIR
jgi:hypothetical protein